MHARGCALERRAAHADGVDLVDEDDALAAPLARELLRLVREPADDDGVHADEGLLEARAGHRNEGAVETCGNSFCKHCLPGARRAQEEQPSLPSPAGLLESLARLPEGDDAVDLLLRLVLTSHVREADAPIGIAWL